MAITSNPSNIVLDGSPATLSCSGTLSSAPVYPSLLSIMWNRRGILTTSNVSLSNGGTVFTGTLTIDPFTISSLGNYRCVAMIDNSTVVHLRSVTAICKHNSMLLILTV